MSRPVWTETLSSLPEIVMRTRDGRVIPLRRDRWLSSADPDDRDLINRVVPPAIDVGCGPGRHLLEMCGRGMTALGVEVAAHAVELARAKGVPVLRRSVFDRLPGEGRWQTVLVLDGSIGIGGSPPALLARLAGLLAPGAKLLVETEPPDVRGERLLVRLEAAGEASPWFPWARVNAGELEAEAEPAGFRLCEAWRGVSSDRWFAELLRGASVPKRRATPNRATSSAHVGEVRPQR
jgi:SAM-dependent methyltransferase